MELTFSVIRLILQANFASVVSVLVLIAFILTNTSFSDSINRCFILTCISLLLLIISDDMRFYYGHLPYPTFYRYVAAGTGYTLRPIIVFLLSIIASRYNIKKKTLLILPLAICSIISIISIFPFGKGIMFSFSDENVCIRGPFGYFSHFLTIAYSILSIYYSSKNYSQNKFEPMVLVLVEIAGLTATILVHFFGYDFLLSQVFISAIIFYYFFLVTQIYKRDTLTSFLNRRCFYLEINHLLKKPMILLSMDLNNLKVFNDTKGHAEGDKALSTSANLMKKHFAKYAKLYRTGGDEFMAVFKKQNFSEIESIVKKFQDALAKTEYRVACGIAEYKPGDDINETISLCDERMYSNKVKIKNTENFKKI